jgi:hypothetical protein
MFERVRIGVAESVLRVEDLRGKLSFAIKQGFLVPRIQDIHALVVTESPIASYVSWFPVVSCGIRSHALDELTERHFMHVAHGGFLSLQFRTDSTILRKKQKGRPRGRPFCSLAYFGR